MLYVKPTFSLEKLLTYFFPLYYNTKYWFAGSLSNAKEVQFILLTAATFYLLFWHLPLDAYAKT